MKKSISTAIVAAAFAFSSMNAKADDSTNKFYLDVDGGGMFQQNITLQQQVGASSYKSSATYKAGGRVDLILGYRLSNHFSAELESGLLWNSMDKVGGVSLSSVGQGLDQYNIPFIANVLYRGHGAGPITPYVGVGVGGLLNVSDVTTSPGNSNTDTDFTFAYQAEAGFKYALSKHVSLGLAYKFLGSMDQNIYVKNLNDHLTFKGVYTHSVLLTLVWQF